VKSYPSPSQCHLHFAGDHAYCDSVAFHEHACPELILVVDGFCQTDTPQQRFESGPGDLLLVPAGASHNQVDHGLVRSLYVGFDSQTLLVREAQLIRLANIQLIQQCMEILVQLHMRRWQASTDAVNGLLMALLMEVSSKLKPSAKERRLDRRLQDLLHWLQSHLHEPLSVQTLANEAQVSESRLFQMFSQAMNVSPMQYVQAQRLDRARQYLQDPYLSIKQIAFACGYPDHNLFTRIFRQQHGQPPVSWRRTHCV
jgi:AraC-like DNA-binding protein